MKVNFIHEKGIGKNNEDGFLIKNNIWGVFDGATSLNKFTDQTGKTGGLIASTIAKKVFEKNNKSLKNLAIETNTKIKKEMEKFNIDITDKLNLWGTNLAVVKINKDKIKWIQISDATIIFIYKDNSFKVITEEEQHDKDLLMKWKKLPDKKDGNLIKILHKQAQSVRRKMNIDYGCLNGEKEAVNFLFEGYEDLKNVKHIIIFTDGFMIPKEDPAESEPWEWFVEMYLKSGIKKIKKEIRKMEKADPKLHTYPRIKKHDDITAISIEI
ncbi:MAG: hypothetical protein ABIC82_00770 [bacterium]